MAASDLAVSSDVRASLASVLETHRETILDNMLDPAWDSLHRRSFGLSILAAGFLDHFSVAVREDAFSQFFAWLDAQRHECSPEARGILKSGCVAIATAYATTGRPGADIARVFSSVSVAISNIIEHQSALEHESVVDDRQVAVDAMLVMLREHDPGSYYHSRDVSAWSRRIGVSLGFKRETCDSLERAGAVHAIGKIHIARELLSRSVPLSDDELHAVRQYPRHSERILKAVPQTAEYAETALYHLERYDGSGPHLRSRNEIPIGSRVIGVAGAFAAMISQRPYRSKKVPSQALFELIRGAGSQFDPEVVTALGSLVRGRSRADQTAAASRA